MNTTPVLSDSSSFGPDNARWVYVDPERAQQWLANAHPQLRRIQPYSRPVKRYTEDMKSGRWVRQADGCIMFFDAQGRILSGRKRLLAMIAANYSMHVLAITVSDENARFVLDSGQSRSAGDALAIGGVTNANDTAALISRIHAIWSTLDAMQRASTASYKRSANPLSHAETLDFAMKHAETLRIAVRLIPGGVPGMVLTATDMRALYYVFTQMCPDYSDEVAYEFFESLVRGVELRASDQVYILRERLAKMYRNDVKAGSANEYVLTKAFKALIYSWNIHVRGEASREIVNPGLPFPACACGQHRWEDSKK